MTITQLILEHELFQDQVIDPTACYNFLMKWNAKKN